MDHLGLDELLGMGQKNKNMFPGKSIVAKHDLYLTGEIKAADNILTGLNLSVVVVNQILLPFISILMAVTCLLRFS